MFLASRVSSFARRVLSGAAPAVVIGLGLGLAPAVQALAVDPNGGGHGPNTGGAGSGTGSGTGTGTGTGASSGSGGTATGPVTSTGGGISVATSDVCVSGTLDEASFEATAQAAIDAKLPELGGVFLGLTVAVPSATVTFACEDLSGDALDACDARALDTYRTCIGWGEHSKPGAGSDFIGCWNTYQSALDACEAANSTPIWQSSLVIDAVLTAGSATGSFAISARVETRKFGKTTKSCLADPTLSGFSIDSIWADTIEDALVDALDSDICW